MPALETIVLVISAAASSLAIVGGVIGLIIFAKNNKRSAEADGAWRQRQEDANKALNTKIDGVTDKLDTLTDVVEEVRGEQKKANTRMEKLCTYHTVNHAGQPL